MTAEQGVRPRIVAWRFRRQLSLGDDFVERMEREAPILLGNGTVPVSTNDATMRELTPNPLSQRQSSEVRS